MRGLKTAAATAILVAAFICSQASAQHVVVGGGGGAPALGMEAKGCLLVNPVGLIYMGGVEIGMPQQSISLEVLAGGYEYDYWEGSYNEWGSGTIVSAISRFYQTPERLGGWFGAGITFIDGGFHFYDGGSYGWGWVSGIAPTFSGGYKYPLPNTTAVIDPNVVLVYIPDASSDLSVIFGAGVSVGFMF